MVTVPKPTDTAAWELIRTLAADLQSDGCTGVKDFYQDSCLYHDVLCRTGVDPFTGEPITAADADYALRRSIQDRSRFGRFSPMSWIRWIGVRTFRPIFGYGPKEPSDV
jgi:hypothetical protein